jgi:hypothetical protein
MKGPNPCLLCDETLARPSGQHEEMEVNGFEPMTPCLQSRCSPS